MITKNEYKVLNNKELLDYLINDLNIKRSKAKSLLSYKCILINNRVVSQYNYLLKTNDVLTILNAPNNNCVKFNLEIIYEDNDFIVINKPAGLLSMSDGKTIDNTAYHMVKEYLNNKYEKVFILHRLDKETSGILVFVKNETIKNTLQQLWDDVVKERKYYAVVKGQLDKQNDHIINYLKENSEKIVYSTDSTNKYAKQCITDYKVLKSNNNYSLVDVDIKTGRKNQIRVTFADLNHPVVNDDKYGTKDPNINRLALHAYKLVIFNPINNKIYNFESKMPFSFKKLVK